MTPDDVATIGRAINEIVAPLRARIADLERCEEGRVKADAVVAASIVDARKDIANTRERVAEVCGALGVLNSARHDDRRASALDIDASIDDGRTLKLTLGGQFKELRLPIPIHRGKYEAGKEYEQADEVALHGCTWRAKADRPTGEPGASGDWLLVAKAGGARQ